MHAVRYLRERWVTPDGKTIIAPLPDGTRGHFGPDLRRFVLMQYHQSQTTLPRLATLLQSVGVAISKREIQRLLTESRTASWPKTATCCGPAYRPRLGYLSMTPARGIKRRTAIARRSATSVSPRPRGAGLVRHAVIKEPVELFDRRAGHTDFVSNDAAFDYMRSRALSAPLIAVWPSNRKRCSLIRPPGRRISTGSASPNWPQPRIRC